MNVREIIRIITGAVNATAPDDTVDTLKIGNPNMEVTGIVTAFTATPEVFRKAAELGANLIVTHEPTFYDHRDAISWQKNHAVYKKKQEMASQSGISVWRFHDLAHMNRPDFIVRGMEEVPVPLNGRWRPCLPMWMRWWSEKPANGWSANIFGMHCSLVSIWALW